jgi:hypothetical protein
LIVYVDDSAILFTHKNPDAISSKLGNVLEKFSDWLIDNTRSERYDLNHSIELTPITFS